MMRVLISPARPVESTKPPMWITYVKTSSREKGEDGSKSKRKSHREHKESPHLGLQPKDYPVGALTLREGTQALASHGALALREYHHGLLTPRSTSTLPIKDAPRASNGLQESKTGTLEMDETLKDILGSQNSRLSKRQSTFQLHPTGPAAVVYPWHSNSSGKKKSARVTNIVKEHSKSRVTTFEDGAPDGKGETKVPPLDLDKLNDDTPSAHMRIVRHKAIPPIQASVTEPELSQTIGVRAHLDLYHDSAPPPSPFTYQEEKKKKKNVVIVAPKLPPPHISGHLDSVRSEGVSRAMDSYNDKSLTRKERSSKGTKKKVVFVTPSKADVVNTARLADGVSQALSSYEGDNFAQPEPAVPKKRVVIFTTKRGPKEEPYFETCRSDGVKGALDFYNDHGLTSRDLPPYVSPRGQDLDRKITEIDAPQLGELKRSRVKSGGVRNTISSFINMDDSLAIKDILATKKRVKTLPTVTPRNPNAIFEPNKDCREVGVVGALTSYNDSSLTPRSVHPTVEADLAIVPRFGPTAQPAGLLNAMEIADKTRDALDTQRDMQQQRDHMQELRNEERYLRDYPDPSKHLPNVHNPEEQRREAAAPDWKWKGPTSAKFQWRTDARKRAKEKFPDEKFDVNNRMHNREFKGPMYLL